MNGTYSYPGCVILKKIKVVWQIILDNPTKLPSTWRVHTSTNNQNSSPTTLKVFQIIQLNSVFLRLLYGRKAQKKA